MKKLLLALTLGCAAPLLADDAIQVVACDAKVPSHKRGVCANKLSAADFRAFAPGVSWYYNWHFKTDSLPPDGVDMEFIPQVWGNGANAASELDGYLSSVAKKPRAVLAVNEPNLKGQAFIDPQTTADLVKRVREVADKYHLPLVGPNMALGSGGGESIKAMDPIEGKEVTYTFFVPFLKAFFSFLGDDKLVDGLGLHSYGNIGELKWATGEMHKQFGKPVWMTEYAEWNAKGPDGALNYCLWATDFLEANPDVAAYAWFKERANNANISLLDPKQDGVLTAVGQMYVALPTHDGSVYYRLPGKLPAANYAGQATDAEPRLSLDGDPNAAIADRGFDMQAKGPNATASYHLQVDAAGTYTVTVRAQGKGPVEFRDKDGTVLGTANPAGDGWSEAAAQIPLAAGPQTLQVKFPGLAIRSLEFKQ